MNKIIATKHDWKAQQLKAFEAALTKMGYESPALHVKNGSVWFDCDSIDLSQWLQMPKFKALRPFSKNIVGYIVLNDDTPREGKKSRKVEIAFSLGHPSLLTNLAWDLEAAIEAERLTTCERFETILEKAQRKNKL